MEQIKELIQKAQEKDYYNFKEKALSILKQKLELKEQPYIQELQKIKQETK